MAAFIELAHGEDCAIISPIGAALLDYTVGGRPVVVGMDAFDGAVLAPWPNRIAEGRYDFDGVSHRLPITEPARGTALHGLVASAEWDVAECAESSVTLRTDIEPSQGYPFRLSLIVSYTLDEGEIRIAARSRNRGSGPAPFGFGFHPWIHPGAATVDEAQLAFAAQTWFSVDDRLIPVDEKHFDTGSLIPADHDQDEASCLACKDFRALRTLGHTVLDDAFGSPGRDTAGWSWARLKGADDRTVVIGMDSGFRAWQVCTGDELAPDRRRTAIAIEPMACPPNAFATGSQFDVLEPQAELGLEWSIALR